MNGQPGTVTHVVCQPCSRSTSGHCWRHEVVMQPTTVPYPWPYDWPWVTAPRTTFVVTNLWVSASNEVGA